ncbi:21584_t:CDS:2 [Gigaspora margarita]|uniref:21584_t:CDS:1 n=1 Tax=Gigaspora margarita TaxID=4874 RepID=A0ABM8VXP4_GIGMA|nr:21584_t:CDS:2 [Gigaspora margarita]
MNYFVLTDGGHVGALLLLFPPSPAKDYETPSVESITKRLQRLLDLGFKPTNAVILDILQLFENRLSGIGKEIIHAFISVRRNETHNEFYKMVITEAIKPERIVKKIEILDFLDEMSGSESSEVFKGAMEHIKEKNSIDRKKNSNHTDHIEVNNFEHSSQPENGCHSTTDSDSNKSNSSVKTISVVPYKPLLYNLTFYNWVLIKFSADSDIAKFAFDDILETRISFNEKSSKKFETKFIETSNIYKVYCNTRNFFSVKHLELLKKVSHEDILYPLFKFYLPDLFGLSYTFKMPMQIIEDSNIYFKPKRKKKKRSISKEEKLGWINALESIHKEIVDQGNSTEMSTEFVNCLEEFYDRLEEIYDDLKMELESSTNTKTKKHKVGKNQKRNKDPISNNIIFGDKELYIYDIADDSNS